MAKWKVVLRKRDEITVEAETLNSNTEVATLSNRTTGAVFVVPLDELAYIQHEGLEPVVR